MQSKIEQRVMAGGGVVYAFRQLTGATALKLYVCALSLYGIGRLVWVSHVFQNWANVGLQGSLEFVSAAIINTHLPVQIVLMVLLFAGFSLLFDLTRSVGGSRGFAGGATG